MLADMPEATKDEAIKALAPYENRKFAHWLELSTGVAPYESSPKAVAPYELSPLGAVAPYESSPYTLVAPYESSPKMT